MTRDPELRYTPQGTAVATFGLATNRQWTTDTGEKKEDTEFHNIVCWNKLAEIVAQFLKKGRQAYVEGRLSTREWEGQDGQKRRTTEIIANEVIFLGGGGPSDSAEEEVVGEDFDIPEDIEAAETGKAKSGEEKTASSIQEQKSKSETKDSDKEKTNKEEDIPF